MQFWKDHKALRLTLILVFFAAGLALVCVGWAMTGKLSGLLIMLVGLVLLLSALMVVFCFTAGANPVPGYTPPHDSAYYAGHLDELAQELNTNFLPVLDETAHAEADGGTVTVTASAKEYVPVRGAVLKFYDAALFTFEKTN